jgi:hypothetical protein
MAKSITNPKIGVKTKKNGIAIVLGVFLFTGCVHQQLKISTNSVIPTLREIQTKQILDNLGYFLANPTAVPVHVAITGGSVQVANQAQPSFKFPFHGLGSEADFQVQGQITENWALAPVSNPTDLARLRALYRRATGAVVNFEKEYPHDIDKDGKEKPLSDTLRAGKQIASSQRSAAFSVDCGTHQGKHVWISSQKDLDDFTMWAFGATSNSVGGDNNKGRPGQVLLNAIQ